MAEETELDGRMRDFEDLMIHCMSDVWLDHPSTFLALETVFQKCVEVGIPPLVFVLCGNFTRKGLAHGQGREIHNYQGSYKFSVVRCSH